MRHYHYTGKHPIRRTPKHPEDCHKLLPKGWKARCRDMNEKYWCARLIDNVAWASRQYCLYTPEEESELPDVSETNLDIRHCKKRWRTNDMDSRNFKGCIWSMVYQKKLFGPGGLYSDPAKSERHANITKESCNCGIWLGAEAFVILILCIIGTIYWFFFRGQKEKGQTKGASKTGKSKLGDKSKISSRKSAKKSSLGSKASQRSKGAKSRLSKSSAKKK